MLPEFESYSVLKIPFYIVEFVLKMSRGLCLNNANLFRKMCFVFSSGEEDLLFSLSLFAGKHIRVWRGSFSAVLYRSPTLHSAHSAPLSSPTPTNSLTFSISSDLGSDLLKVRSNGDWDVFSFFFLPANNSPCSTCFERKLWVSVECSVCSVCLIAYIFISFPGLEDKRKENTVCLHATGQVYLVFTWAQLHFSSKNKKQQPKCTLKRSMNNQSTKSDTNRWKYFEFIYGKSHWWRMLHHRASFLVFIKNTTVKVKVLHLV